MIFIDHAQASTASPSATRKGTCQQKDHLEEKETYSADAAGLEEHRGHQTNISLSAEGTPADLII